MVEQRDRLMTIKASEARQQWSRLLGEVFRGVRVVVEKSGIPVAAIISAQDLERLTKLEEERKARFKALGAIQEAFADIPDEELEREVGRAIAEVRSRRAAGATVQPKSKRTTKRRVKHANDNSATDSRNTGL